MENYSKLLTVYPTRLKIGFRTEAKAPAICAIESSPLLEIGARFDRPIPGLWLGLKSKFSIALGILSSLAISSICHSQETDQPQKKSCLGDYGAFAIRGEAGYKNYRGGATYGVYFSDDHRFKVSGEWLTQKLTYHFHPTREKKWVSQYAIGGEYQYLIGNKIVQSIDLGSAYVHSDGHRLSNKSFYNNKRIFRHIADSDGTLSFLGTTVRLWNCARLTAEANYDWVKYHRKHELGKLANGFGGSAYFVQPFATDFNFSLSAQFRKPFNSYQGSLNWKHFFSGWGIDVGLFGNITDGKEGLPDIQTVGLQLGFSLGGKGCKHPPFNDKKTEQTDCYARAYCNVSDWASRPAVYVPIVLAVEDSKKE